MQMQNNGDERGLACAWVKVVVNIFFVGLGGPAWLGRGNDSFPPQDTILGLQGFR